MCVWRGHWVLVWCVLQAWMRWIIVTTLSGPFSCSGSAPTWRPIRSSKAKAVTSQTERWRFSTSKSTDLPWWVLHMNHDLHILLQKGISAYGCLQLLIVGRVVGALRPIWTSMLMGEGIILVISFLILSFVNLSCIYNSRSFLWHEVTHIRSVCRHTRAPCARGWRETVHKAAGWKTEKKSFKLASLLYFLSS